MYCVAVGGGVEYIETYNLFIRIWAKDVDKFLKCGNTRSLENPNFYYVARYIFISVEKMKVLKESYIFCAARFLVLKFARESILLNMKSFL